MQVFDDVGPLDCDHGRARERKKRFMTRPELGRDPFTSHYKHIRDLGPIITVNGMLHLLQDIIT